MGRLSVSNIQIKGGQTMTKGALGKLLRIIEDHPYHKFIAFRIEEIGQGNSIISMSPSENTLNFSGFVHGGILYTVLDVAAFLACVSISPDDHLPATTNINVSVMRVISKGYLKVEAKVMKMGRRNCFIESRVIDEDGEVIAIGLITKAIVPFTKFKEILKNETI
jgi:uncharacterized protein (TIGR00369 family)